MSRAVRAITLAAVLALAAPACNPPWTILQQASPNPFVNQHHYVLAPFVFDGATVGGLPEQQFLMTERPRTAAAYVNGRSAMAQGFLAELSLNRRHYVEPLATPAAPPGVFVIRPRLIAYHPQRYYGIARGGVGITPASGDFAVQLFAPDGALLDVFQVHATEMGVINGRGLDRSMGGVGHGLGYWVGRYLNDRTTPQQQSPQPTTQPQPATQPQPTTQPQPVTQPPPAPWSPAPSSAGGAEPRGGS